MSNLSFLLALFLLLVGSYYFWKLCMDFYPADFDSLSVFKQQLRIALVPFLFIAYGLFFCYIILTAVGVDVPSVMLHTFKPVSTPVYKVTHIQQ